MKKNDKIYFIHHTNKVEAKKAIIICLRRDKNERKTTTNWMGEYIYKYIFFDCCIVAILL